MALLLKNPVRSSTLRQKHLRSTDAYQTVYSEHFPLDAWPVVASLIRGAENTIVRAIRGARESRFKQVSTWRGLLAYAAVARLIGTFGYKLEDLTSLDLSRVTDEFMNECWSEIMKAAGSHGSNKLSDMKVLDICTLLAESWSISGDPGDGKRNLPIATDSSSALAVSSETDEFLASVNSALPPQPWKPGVHLDVSRQLRAQPKRVSRAIQTLIARGVWNQQQHGIVYDAGGKEVMRDDSRVFEE